MDKLLVSILEAGELLGVGRSSVYGLMNDGKLESLTIGRRRLITTESIKKLVNQEED